MNFQEITSNFLDILVRVILVLLCIVIHEMAHGFVAYKMGDDTAKREGRLSINPLKHVDIVGAICMLFFRFGWAKPVPVNPYRFKNRRRGMILVSLAGPLSNVLVAFISMIAMYLMIVVLPTWNSTFMQSETLSTVIYYLDTFYLMNLGLAVFNLIPIPPLDGSKIIGAFLPEDKFRSFMQYEQLGMIALIILIAFSRRFDILGKILNFGVNVINDVLYQLTEWIFYFAK